MIGYLIWVVRVLLWGLGRLARSIGRGPEYVGFVLEDDYAELPPPSRNFIQKRLLPTKTTLRELTERFDRIAQDRRVRGVVLHLAALNLQLAQLQTIRDELLKLRDAGKRVIVWANTYDMRRYYLASAADEVILQPGGVIEALGIRQSYLFVKDALARVGIEAEVIQISPYKSAGDIATRTTMSDEVREMADWLADSAFGQIAAAVATGRKTDEGSARELIDGSPYTDVEAANVSAVDLLLGEEDLPKHLGREGKPARIVPWAKARRSLAKPVPRRPSRRYVALLRIEGDIVDGRSKRPPVPGPGRVPFLGGRAGDLTVVQHARKVAKDKRAKAAVVFVESGGGSATASEAMAAALDEIAARKPLVACMGSVAGSGGYYVTTPARWVVAQPATLTGSIGVLSGKLVNEGTFGKLRFNRELVTRGRRVTFMHPARPFTDEERKIVWNQINRVYDVFLDRVTKARNRTREEIDAVGGGKVWMGEQALRHGLIDELGGLDRALAKARELAGLHPRARVREVKPGKQDLPPQPLKAAAALVLDPQAIPGVVVGTALDHVAEGLRMFDCRPLCLMPIVPA